MAANEENTEDFVQIHQIGIAFHQAGKTRNLNLMLSLFADDAPITSGGKSYTGKEQIRRYWEGSRALPASESVGCLTPAFRIKYDVEGNKAHLYFECLYVDRTANKIRTHYLG